MRSDELLAACRNTAYIGDANAYPQFTDARLLSELNDKLRSVFSDIVVKTRAGYWLKEIVSTTTAGKARYRIPPRAVVGGLEKIELAFNSGTYTALTEYPASEAQYFDGSATQTTGFWIQGDQVVLLPAPTSSLSMRMSYYLRPSKLVTSQSSTQGGDGVVRGQVTAVDTTARTVTVNTLPFDESLTVPAAITSASQLVDIVHPDGWHELAAVGLTQTISGTTFTLGGTSDLSDVSVGDYVRVADQTDWPCLPPDFHRCLADLAAIKILVETHMLEKAGAVQAGVENDLTRFRSLLLPRVRSDAKRIGCSPIMRQGAGSWLRRS
jgi:hypothetical protein